MLSQQALLDTAEDMEDSLLPDGPEDSWADDLKERFNDAIDATKDSAERLLALARMPDFPEESRVAILLPDVPLPWAPPDGLSKKVEVRLRYQGEPRVLAVMCLSGREQKAQTGATQLYRISSILEECLAADGGAAALPRVWPLQDKITVQMLGAKVLLGKDRSSCLGMLTCPVGLRRCLRDAALNGQFSEVITLTAKHYGGAVAFGFAWTEHYTRLLWAFIAVILPSACTLAFLLEDGQTAVVISDATIGSVEHVFWELTKLLSVAWGLFVAFAWANPDLSGGMPERDTRRVECWAPRYGRNVDLLLTVLVGIPAVLLLFSAAVLLFTFVFWLELYIAYEWGDCVNLGCRDPEEKWGFLGWLVSICPGILEAILFALLSEAASPVADLLLWIRNFELQEARRMFRLVSLVTLEAVSKLGTFGILAMVFVPEWEDETTMAGLPANFASMTATEQRIARNGIDCSDLPGASMLGRGSLLCIRRRLDADYRRWLFQKAMKGPFVVAPFIAILIKVLLPMLLNRAELCFWRCDRRERRTGEAQCCCHKNPCARFIIRAAGLIFANDCGSVGGPKFLVRGSPFEHEMLSATAAQDPGADGCGGDDQPDDVLPGDADSKAAAKRSLKARRKLLRQAVREVHLKTFNPDLLVLDNLLSIQWVVFFACIWPWGCLPTLLAWVVQTRSAWGLLLLVKRRAFPVPPYVLQLVARRFVVVMAHLAAFWHVALSVVTYNHWLPTTSKGTVAGLLIGLWAAAVLAMWLLALGVSFGRLWLHRMLPPPGHAAEARRACGSRGTSS